MTTDSLTLDLRIALLECPEFMRCMSATMPKLRAAATAMCRSRADADDLVQDTFERAMNKLHLFKPGTNLSGWLLTIMRRIFIDGCRAVARVDFQPEIESIPAHEDRSEDRPEAWQALTIADVRWALEQLQEPVRNTYELFAFENLTYAQIAAKLQTSPSTVGTRVLRARRHMRRILADRMGTDAPQ